MALTESDSKLISDFVNARMEKIIALQSQKGLKASGRSAEILRTNLENNIAQVIDGSGYFEFQEFGRAAGKAPPVQKIYEWLAFKKYGIEYETDKQRHAIAYAIQKKISKKGTQTHINNEPTGVLSEAINNQSLQELIGKLINKKTSEVKTDIKRLFE